MFGMFIRHSITTPVLVHRLTYGLRAFVSQKFSIFPGLPLKVKPALRRDVLPYENIVWNLNVPFYMAIQDSYVVLAQWTVNESVGICL